MSKVYYVARQKEWETDWEVCPDWERGGGQGTVRLVAQRGDASGARFVLKELKSWKDLERRERMRREVVVLETIHHRSTPRVVVHNTEHHADITVPLFAVFDYVNGPTLAEFVEKRGPDRMGLDEAKEMVLRLLDVLDIYHGAGVGHRDIKPDNVILRDENCADPVLIDFGQTFNVDDRSEPTTYAGQQVGNRFLALPEHATTSGNKRDFRSDLTFCCGILLFALTGAEPAVLADEQHRMPHQREAARAALDLLPEPTKSRVLNAFDVGFQLGLDRRWQSVEALRNHLLTMTPPTPGRSSTDAGIERLRARAEAAAGNRAVLDALGRVQARVQEAGRDAVRRLGPGYRSEFEYRLPSMAGANAWIWFTPIFGIYPAFGRSRITSAKR